MPHASAVEKDGQLSNKYLGANTNIYAALNTVFTQGFRDPWFTVLTIVCSGVLLAFWVDFSDFVFLMFPLQQVRVKNENICAGLLHVQ